METTRSPFAALAAFIVGTLFIVGLAFAAYIVVQRGISALPPAQLTINGQQPAARPVAPALNQRPAFVPPAPQAQSVQAQPDQQVQSAPATAPVENAEPVQVQREILSIQQVPVDQPDAVPVEVRRVIIQTNNQSDEVVVSDRGSKRKNGK